MSDLQRAQKIVRATRLRMKGKYGETGDYIRGWREGLAEAEWLLKLNTKLEKSEHGPRPDHKPRG